nr:MAG TPA: hypothetical protein [Caudoviricetes sp.]
MESTVRIRKELFWHFRRTTGLPWTGFRVRLLKKCLSAPLLVRR